MPGLRTSLRESREMFWLFRNERRDPEPFYERLAQGTVASLPFELCGKTILDLGCGPGHYARALRDEGATVIPVDLDPAEFALPGGPPGGELVADGRQLPMASEAFDAVVCSNMLEHTPRTAAVLAEVRRVLRPGGCLWLSWTNWYSPWGGHEISPFHYLGPRLGMKVHARLRPGPWKNVPGEHLFPVHIGPTIAMLRSDPGWVLEDASPRYYPSQRWLLALPGVREVAVWNCVLVLRRSG